VTRVRDAVLVRPWSPRAAVAATVATCALGLAVVAQGPVPERGLLVFLAGASWAAMGAYHRTRHEGPLGAMAMATAILWFAGRLDEAGDPLLFTVGNILALTFIAPALLTLITVPTGRLSLSPGALDPTTGRTDPRHVRNGRLLIISAAGWSLLLHAWVLFDPDPNPSCPGECAGRNLLLADRPDIASGIQAAQAAGALVLGVLVTGWFRRARRNSDPRHRHAFAPLSVVIVMLIILSVAYILASNAGRPAIANAVFLMFLLAVILVPVAQLSGIQRLAELERSAMAFLEPNPARSPEEIEAALRTALREPRLRLTPAEGVGDLAPVPAGTLRSLLQDEGGRPVGAVDHALPTPGSQLLARAMDWAQQRLGSAPPEPGEDVATWEPRIRSLTDTELATAARLCDQRTNGEIAEEFVLAIGSVNNRVSRIYAKLEVRELGRRERAAAMLRIAPLVRAELDRREGSRAPAGSPRRGPDDNGTPRS